MKKLIVFVLTVLTFDLIACTQAERFSGSSMELRAAEAPGERLPAGSDLASGNYFLHVAEGAGYPFATLDLTEVLRRTVFEVVLYASPGASDGGMEVGRKRFNGADLINTNVIGFRLDPALVGTSQYLYSVTTITVSDPSPSQSFSWTEKIDHGRAYVSQNLATAGTFLLSNQIYLSSDENTIMQ
jgi:hypothetical protein